jgi:hypothetical protein
MLHGSRDRPQASPQPFEPPIVGDEFVKYLYQVTRLRDERAEILQECFEVLFGTFVAVEASRITKGRTSTDDEADREHVLFGFTNPLGRLAFHGRLSLFMELSEGCD